MFSWVVGGRKSPLFQRGEYTAGKPVSSFEIGGILKTFKAEPPCR